MTRRPSMPVRVDGEAHISIALSELRVYLDIPESATLVGILRDLVKRTRGERVTTYDGDRPGGSS